MLKNLNYRKLLYLIIKLNQIESIRNNFRFDTQPYRNQSKTVFLVEKFSLQKNLFLYEIVTKFLFVISTGLRKIITVEVLEFAPLAESYFFTDFFTSVPQN